MRSRIRPILMALAVTATATALSTGQAAAGGPTSVLVVNPVTGEAGALYATDGNYQALQEALEPARGVSVEQPPGLSGGPGSSAINITWLVHDVAVWRVDHVRVDPKYVWVQTNVMGDGVTPFDGNGQWHVAADPAAVLDVLDELGVLPDTPPATNGLSAAESLGVTEESVGASEPDAAAATPTPTVPGWQWIAVAAVAGIALGATGRPALAGILRRRASGPHQQLVDLVPPERTEPGSGQPDPDPAKAPSLVLDLGNLDPADLSR